jgi:hypothetical protein
MSRASVAIRAGWVGLALLFAYASTLGGDTSILFGWVFLTWTAPFSILWWFYLYDFARQYMSAAAAQPIGLISVIVLAYLFWFVLVPYLWTRARRTGKLATPGETDTGRERSRGSS